MAINTSIQGILSSMLKSVIYASKTAMDTASGDHLIGRINQYYALKQSLLVTYGLINMANVNARYLDKENQSIPAIITPAVEDNFGIDDTIEIKEPMDMGEYSIAINMVVAEIESASMNEDRGESFDSTTAVIDGVKAIIDGINKLNDTDMLFGDATTIINIMPLLATSPRALKKEDVAAIRESVEEKIAMLEEFSALFEDIPTYEDSEIDAFITSLGGMGLTEYIDNIMNGDVLKNASTTASHAWAIVGSARYGAAALSACLNMKATISAKVKTPNIMRAVDEVSYNITLLTAWAEHYARTTSAKAIEVALKAMGVSKSLLDCVICLKMHVQQLQRDAEESIRNIELLKSIPAASTAGNCPINVAIMTNTAMAMANATIKNAALMPAMAIANTIIKPIFDAVTDITSDVLNYQEMLGASLMQAFNLIDINRWIVYVLHSQIVSLSENINSQMSLYGQIAEELRRLEGSIPKKQENKYKTIENILNKYLVSLRKYAKEHDKAVLEQRNASRQLEMALATATSMQRVITGRELTRSDKQTFMTGARKISDIANTEESARKKVAATFDTLNDLWAEMAKQNIGDFMANAYKDLIETFMRYSNIVRLVFGLNLKDSVDGLRDALKEASNPQNQTPLE